MDFTVHGILQARQNTGVGSLSLLQGNLPNPGIEPRSPALQEDSLPAELWGKPKVWPAALARNRTWVSCLEGSYAHHYITNAEENMILHYVSRAHPMSWKPEYKKRLTCPKGILWPGWRCVQTANFPGSPASLPALQVLHLLASMITWANFLKIYIFTSYWFYFSGHSWHMLIQTAGCRDGGLARGLKRTVGHGTEAEAQGVWKIEETEWRDPASQNPLLCRPSTLGFHTQSTALLEHEEMTVDWRARETPVSYWAVLSAQKEMPLHTSWWQRRIFYTKKGFDRCFRKWRAIPGAGKSQWIPGIVPAWADSIMKGLGLESLQPTWLYPHRSGVLGISGKWNSSNGCEEPDMPTRAPSRVTDRGCPRVTFSGQREGPFIGKKVLLQSFPSSCCKCRVLGCGRFARIPDGKFAPEGNGRAVVV